MLGTGIFFFGLRLTEEVLPVLFLTIVSATSIGFSRPDRPWLWGLAVGIGTRVGGLFEPALSTQHGAKFGDSQPLPLPFGLTEIEAAQYVAGSLVIIAFPFVAAYVGWALGRFAASLKQAS